MAKLNPKDFTLIVAKDIQKMLTFLRRLQVDNSDVIEVLETEQLFYFHDIKHKNFTFYVGVPDKKSNGQPTMFPITYSPVTSDSKNSFTSQAKIDGVITSFNIWYDLIKDYNTVSFDDEEDFLKMYEDEIFADFEIIDEDADVKPFDNNQQVILYKFLETTVIYLKKEYPDNQIIKEIIEEANTLKVDIPILSKRVAIRRFSKVLAKIQKFNPITFKDLYDVAKKEVIKYLLLKSVETLPKIITNITQIIGS